MFCTLVGRFAQNNGNRESGPELLLVDCKNNYNVLYTYLLLMYHIVRRQEATYVRRDVLRDQVVTNGAAFCDEVCMYYVCCTDQFYVQYNNLRVLDVHSKNVLTSID